jgi:hypothetical protein
MWDLLRCLTVAPVMVGLGAIMLGRFQNIEGLAVALGFILCGFFGLYKLGRPSWVGAESEPESDSTAWVSPEEPDDHRLPEPYVEEPTDTHVSEAAPPERSGKRSVVLVDDDKSSRDFSIAKPLWYRLLARTIKAIKDTILTFVYLYLVLGFGILLVYGIVWLRELRLLR